MKNLLSVVSILFVLLGASSVCAQEVPPPAATGDAVKVERSTLPAAAVTFGGKFSSDSNLGYVDILAPFAGNDTGFVFVDPRVSIAEGSENEQNIGLGARKLVMDEKLIIGGNVFYDSRETANNNRFGQVGAGLELLTEWVDARVNGYWPNDDKETIDSYDTQEQDISVVNYWKDPYFIENRVEQRGTQVTTTRTVNRHFDKFEEALDGFDFEIGLKIPGIEKIAETRVFGGYYKYSSNYGEDIKGWKSRLEIRALPALIIDAELYEDKKLHGTDYYIGARLNVPFNFGNLFSGKNPFEGAKAWFKRGSRTMKDRMTEMVIRDLDVITEESDYMEDLSRKVDVTTVDEVALRQTLRDDITFVSKDYTGAVNDGTFEQPYTTIQDGVDNAFGDRYVYVDNEGNPYVENVVMRKNVKLWGSGYAEFGCESGVKPIIDGGGNLLSNVLMLRDNNEVMGFMITGGGNGIYSNGRSNINIHHNKIYRNRGVGILVECPAKKNIAGYTITENIIKNNKQTFIGDDGHAISFTIEGGGRIEDIFISRNLITKNQNDGIDMDSRNGSKFKNILISKNRILANSAPAGPFSSSDAIDFSIEDASTFKNCTIIDNTIKDNQSDGVEMDFDDDSKVTNIAVVNNIIYRSGTDGIDIDTDDTDTLLKNTLISGNSIKRSGGNGIEMDLEHSKIENLVVRDNYIAKSNESGVDIDVRSGARVTDISLINNTSTGSVTGDGIVVDVNGSNSEVNKVLFLGNVSTNNNSDGIVVPVFNNGLVKKLVLKNNVVVKNRRDGIWLTNAVGSGTFTKIYMGDIALDKGGYNSIYDNNKDGGFLDFRNDSGINGLSAENNWWGQDSNPKTDGLVGGFNSIDVKPWLSSDPN